MKTITLNGPVRLFKRQSPGGKLLCHTERTLGAGIQLTLGEVVMMAYDHEDQPFIPIVGEDELFILPGELQLAKSSNPNHVFGANEAIDPMHDFEGRLIQPFVWGLGWRWSGTRVETELVEGRVPNNSNPGTDFVVIDPTRKYVVVRIHYTEEFKVEFPDWKHGYASPFNRAVALILYSLGLGCLLADAIVHRDGYFTFWVERNVKVYESFLGSQKEHSVIQRPFLVTQNKIATLN